MGGKKHQAQRTKNNAKHSSSGRTAELLSNSSQFSSFTSLKGGSASSASTVNLEVFGPNLDPNLTVILKKLNKKDATTRFKALNELAPLLKDLDDQSVISLLPCWVKFYNNLVVDVDHKVREATQIAHKAISIRAGRNIAPYIKQVVPSWFVSQCDTHPPAASAASQAFKEAFPPHKIVDAIVFCQNEIVKFISDNLLSEKVIVNKDEQIEAKLERVTIACLNGYALYLSRIPRKSLESALDYNRSIVSSPQFWEFQDHKSRNVRTAFYSLLTSLLQNAPVILDTQHKPLTHAILSKIDEYDPVVLSSVWECVLHLVTVIPNCWLHVNVGRLFLNKITSIISSGGHGSASVIFPNILPLLSKIPQEEVKNESQFYNRLFSSFQQGMVQQSVILSQSESEAVTTSFHECVRFIMLKNLDNSDICKMIVKDHLISLHSKLMLNSAFHLLMNSFYFGFVQNLLFWHRNCDLEPAYQSHLTFIWESLPAINAKHMDKFGDDSKKLAFIYECQIMFIDAINRPYRRKKKHLKVKFVRDEELDCSEKTLELPPVLPDSALEMVQTKLYYLVDELMKKYFTIACCHESHEVISMNVEQLWKLTCVLNHTQLNKLGQFKTKELCPALVRWLKCNYIQNKYVLGLILNTLENMEESDRGIMLAQLSLIRFDETMLEVIKVASHKMSDSNIFKEWLQSTTIRQAIIVSFVERIELLPSCVHFLEMCCATYKSGEPVLGWETLLALLDVIIHTIETRDASAAFVSAVFNLFLIEKHCNIVQVCNVKILHLLFITLPTILFGNEEELGKSWQKGVRFIFRLLPISEISQFVDKCLKYHLELLNRREQLCVAYINKAAKLMFSLCITCEELAATNPAKKELKKHSSMSLTRVMNSDWDALCLCIEELVYLSEVVKGNSLYFSSAQTLKKQNGEIRSPFVEFQIIKFASSLVFCSQYLSMVVGAVVLEDFECFEFDLVREKMCSEISSIDILSKLSQGLLLCQRCILHFPSLKECAELQTFCSPLESSLTELIKRLRLDEQKDFLEHIAKRAQDNNGRNVWKYTYANVQRNMLELELEVLTEALPSEFVISSEFLNLVRTSSDKEYIQRVLGNIVDTYSNSLYSVFNKNLSVVSSEQLRLNAEIGRFLQMVVERHSEIIDGQSWDFIMISVSSWFNTISTANHEEKSEELAQFMASVTSLLISFVRHFVESDIVVSSPLYEEWNKLFANDAYTILRELWTTMAERALSENVTTVSLLLINSLGEAICLLCEWSVPGANFVSPQDSTDFVTSCMKLITAPYVPIQVTTYLMLCNAIPYFIGKDSKLTEKNLSQLSCQGCLAAIGVSQSVVTSLLHDYRVGISCVVRPFTDGYNYTLSYLMLWCWLVELCRACCDSQLRYVYTLWIKENNLVPNIMESIFKLMPESLLYLDDTVVRKKKELFTSRPTLSFESWSSEKLSHFSCWLYIAVLRTLPAVARQWTTETDPKFLPLVDKVTTSYVSPILCNEELEAIRNEQVTFSNVQVQTHPTVREVVATYTIEDISTELTIKLPSNYPLVPPKVEISNAIKSSNQNRQQLMQLTLFLTHQNGSIWEGLLLWKSNLDKKFEGVEECYICFSIVHNSSHQLPKMACQTCRKKFHSFCLYKWFTMSSMSSCPICRNHF